MMGLLHRMANYLELKQNREIVFEIPPLDKHPKDTDMKESELSPGERRTIQLVRTDELVRAYSLLLDQLYFKVSSLFTFSFELCSL